jgi:hypothetical protein
MRPSPMFYSSAFLKPLNLESLGGTVDEWVLEGP